jgi:hypothetical protein
MKQRRWTIETSSSALRLKPTEQVLRLVCERAHVGHTHVEEMARIVRCVSEPAANLGGRLDHADRDVAHARVQDAGQMHGSKCARCTAACRARRERSSTQIKVRNTLDNTVAPFAKMQAEERVDRTPDGISLIIRRIPPRAGLPRDTGNSPASFPLPDRYCVDRRSPGVP